VTLEERQAIDEGRLIEYEPALDGLRALAVVAVVLYHAGATSALPGLAPGGFLGVSVFFTLSGYLVTTLLVRESERDGRVDFRRFWSRRVKRLAPASMAVVLAAVVLAGEFWSAMRAIDAAAGLFGFTNWHVILSGEDELLRTIVGPLGPFWSLAVEEQFYVLLSVAVLVAARTRRPIRTLGIVVVLGWIGSVLAQVLISGPQFRLEFGTDTRGAELLAGCGLAVLLHVRPGLVARCRSWLPVAGALSLVLLTLLVATTDYEPPWLLRGGYGAVSLVSATLVASLLVAGPVTNMLGRSPIVAIGRLSYSWYVVHWPVILILTADRTGLDRWPLVMLKVIASLLAATLLHLTIEQPVRRRDARLRPVITIWLSISLAVLALAVIVL